MKRITIKLGDCIETPEYDMVKIRATFDRIATAELCGFSVGTGYRDSEWHIRGKYVGENQMIFAAVKRN